MQGAMGKVQTESTALQRRIEELLKEYAGAELIDSVAVGELSKGMLTLYVADAAVLYQLRLIWEQKVLQIVQAHLPAAGIYEIRFTTMMPR